MKPRPITEDDLAYWAELKPMRRTFTGPGEQEAGIPPCPAIVTLDQVDQQFGDVVRVAWQLDDADIAALTEHRTIWLSTWGGLPMHQIEAHGKDETTTEHDHG